MMGETYEQIKKCYVCDGIDPSCDRYTSIYAGDRCGWHKVIESDLEKIARGEEFLTFPQLKEIIRKKKNR